MSAAPDLTLSITAGALAAPAMVNGMPSLPAIMRVISAAGPRASPVFPSMVACTGLRPMNVARNVPVGARFLARSFAHAGSAASKASRTIDRRAIELSPGQKGILASRGQEAAGGMEL